MSRPGTAGCFLSQFQLWNYCYHTNKTIAIFEHDVIFKKPMEQQYKFKDVIYNIIQIIFIKNHMILKLEK